jgi:hypothetical protein
MNDGLFGDTRTNERSAGALRVEHDGHRVSATLVHDRYHLALTVLVPGIATVAAVFLSIGWLYAASKIPTVHLDIFSLSSDDPAPRFVCHRFPQLVQQNECLFIGQARVTTEDERAPDLVAEHGDRSQVLPLEKLVQSK